MTDQELNTGSEMAAYIGDVKKQIQTGLGSDAYLAGPINLEMSTTLEKSKSGVFNISVLQAGAKINNQEVHKISLQVGLKSNLTDAEEKAKIADAKFKATLSEKSTKKLEEGAHPLRFIQPENP